VSPPHRAFDFWVGEWLVYRTGTTVLAGHSTIRSEDSGCVITEQWRSEPNVFGGLTGRSLNLYDETIQQWRQFWMDSTGDVTLYTGHATATGMVFTAEGDRTPGQEGASTPRMTFTRNIDGTVRQVGDVSTDGENWSARYDLTYRPAF
jgi:hypothetical protein